MTIIFFFVTNPTYIKSFIICIFLKVSFSVSHKHTVMHTTYVGVIYDKSHSRGDLTSVINLTPVHLQCACGARRSERLAVSRPRIISQSPKPPAEQRWGSVLHNPWGMSLSRCHISPAVCSGLMRLRDIRPLWSPAGTVSRGWWEKYRAHIRFFRFHLFLFLLFWFVSLF